MPESVVSQPVAIERPPEREPESGLALCLSGGGYRAMLFHLGAVWRLNESGYLPKLDRVSSVSGGSITAGTLGMVWQNLSFSPAGAATNFIDLVVTPVRAMAGVTVDRGAILGGLFTPGSISSKVASEYDENLFHGATLQDLPSDDDGPRFIINATNLQTGVLWRFSRPYMADYKLGRVLNPTVSLSKAVAASSAFPPVLSPTILEVEAGDYDPESNDWELAHMQNEGRVTLTDGGVYDNFGLETAWKRYTTIFVSDGGGQLSPEASVDRDWARQSLRVLKVIDNQVRSLRKRQVIGAYQREDRQGTYWGIRSDPVDYGLSDPVPTNPEKIKRLASIQTRLKRMNGKDQEQLINWGYVICDTALRKWVDPGLARPSDVPYPSSGIA